MRIYPIINISNRINTIKNSKISFGEYDGDDYSYSYNRPYNINESKAEYALKKSLINEKYNNMRASWIDDCEELELDNSIMWKRLHEIEQLRERELAQLQSLY